MAVIVVSLLVRAALSWNVNLVLVSLSIVYRAIRSFCFLF
jgi:hypothetical protein